MCSRRNRGFTLIEMLVVITIIVMAMGLAVPAIKSLTGSRSQEAAQNTLTTALGSARARAIAMQHVCGIMFFVDTGTDRVNCVMVEETTPLPTDSPANIIYLDCVDGVDPLVLPAGLRMYTMKDTMPKEYTGQFTEYFTGRYMGYNYPGTNTPQAASGNVVNPLGGVILFDSSGRLTFKDYGYRFMYPPPAPGLSARISQLGVIVYGANGGLPPDWPTTANPPFLFSSAGLVIVDRETFLNHTATSGNQFTDWNQQPNQKDVDNFLDTNATPIFVNRYDGTLMGQ